MAFKIFANALLVEPDFNPLSSGFSKKANHGVSSSFDIKAFSPKEYLFSHCTIIASVDVEDDCQHHIKLGSEKYINQNYDSWTRGVIKNSYRSFVGAPNYVEHVQVPELSKGTIVDAVLRDIKGETLYCDILVATHRKHAELVDRIKKGSMKAMSMGCIAAFTYCTKCGNKAHNEQELCDHVKFQKGSKFIDKQGNFRTIAELCGHESDPSSVKFIEASWVEVPAFTGAVLRNVVSLDDSLSIKVAGLGELTTGFRRVANAGPKPLMGPSDTETVTPEEEEGDMQATLKALFGEDSEDTDSEKVNSTNSNEDLNVWTVNPTTSTNDSVLPD